MSRGGLKDSARKIIMEDVFRPLHIKGEWKVLVVDSLGKSIISTCLKMNDMLDNGITLIETLSLARQPLTYLDAMYFVRPNRENIKKIRADFGDNKGEIDSNSGPLYKAAHLFFTEIIQDDLLIELAKSDMAPYIQTVKEVNLAFLPVEERVFSLDNPNAFSDYYGGKVTEQKLEEIAEQLVTVCATLDEAPCPKVRICNSNLDCVRRLAEKVQSKLEKYKDVDILTANNRSQLIIVDRGFDPISPVLHELTFQAMGYDLLDKNKINPAKNTYTLENSSIDSENKKEIILDDSNELWRELRHLHISKVVEKVNEKTQALTDKYAKLRGGGGGDANSLAEMKSMITQMPKYKREEANHNCFVQLAEDCMKAYESGTVARTVTLEQDMATGFDSTHRPIGDPMKDCVPVFVKTTKDGPIFTAYQKLRVLILYVLNKKEQGHPPTKETLGKLITKAGIQKEEDAVNNLAALGIDIFGNSEIPPRNRPRRKERDVSNTFQTSRWTPLVMDIMEAVVDKNLDPNDYPSYQADTQNNNDMEQGVTSLRAHGKKNQPVMGGQRTGPKLIIFVMGSISYSEMRCAHQVSEGQASMTRTGWEVIIGSDNILTPESYLDKLIHLND